MRGIFKRIAIKECKVGVFTYFERTNTIVDS